MSTSTPGSEQSSQIIPLEWAGGGQILENLFKNGDWQIFKNGRILEGRFIQVDKSGRVIHFTTGTNTVILGALASTPRLFLPNHLILAEIEGATHQSPLSEVPKFVPMEGAKLEVHSIKMRCLRLHLWTGQHYYLQLHAPTGEEAPLFRKWMCLINLLHLARATPNGERDDRHQLWTQAIRDTNEQWSAEMEQKSKWCAVASEESPSTSGAVQPSPQEPSGIEQTKAYPSENQPRDSVSEATLGRRKVFYRGWTKKMVTGYVNIGKHAGRAKKWLQKLITPLKEGNAPNGQKSATDRKAQVTSQGSSKSAMPPQKRKQGLTQSSLGEPSASPVKRPRMSAAMASSDAGPQSEVIGPSKMGAVSEATRTGKNRQASSVSSEASSQKAFPTRGPWRCSRRARRSHGWVDILEAVPEEDEEAAMTEDKKPIFRETEAPKLSNTLKKKCKKRHLEEEPQPETSVNWIKKRKAEDPMERQYHPESRPPSPEHD